MAYVSERLNYVPPRDSIQYHFIDMVNVLLRNREIQLEFSRQISVVFATGPHEKGYLDKILPRIASGVNESFGIFKEEEKTPEETISEAEALFKVI